MANRIMVCGMACFLLMAVGAVCAQDNDGALEDLLNMKVSSVGFFNMEQKKAPGYTTVFDRDFIHAHSARTVGELLNNYAPGMSVGNREFGAMVAQRGVMVDSSSKTNILLGGKNMNSRSNFGYMLPLDIPFLGYIDRVEAVNGPGAIVHGSGAINGFVNIVPKNGKNSPGWTITEEYGFTDDLYKTEVGYGHVYDKGDVYVYGGMVKADGWVPDTGGVLGVNGSGSQHYTGSTARPPYIGQFDPASFETLVNWNHGKFDLLVDVMDMYYDGPSGSAAGLGPTNTSAGLALETRNHAHVLLKPSYTFDVADNDTFKVTPSVYVLSDVYWNRASKSAVERKQSSGHNNLSEIEYALKGVYKTQRFDDHQLALGASVSHRDFYDQRSLFHDTQAGDASSPSMEKGTMFDWNEWSVFGEDVISMTDKWTLSAGLRLDGVQYGQTRIKNGNYTSSLSVSPTNALDDRSYWALLPRLANAYQFTDTLTGKLTYQKGFRDPDIAYFRVMNTSAQSIKPEYMDSLEASLTKDLFDKKLKLDVNVFWNYLKDTIGWNRDTSGGATAGYGNMHKAFRMHGFELIAKYQPRKGTDLLASYNFAAPDHYSKALFNSPQGYILPMSEDGKTLLGTPAQYLKASVAHSFLRDKDGIGRAGVELSTRYWFGTNASCLESLNASAATHPAFRKARFEVDAMARYNVTKDLSLKLIGKNLTAPRYAKPTNSAIGNTTTYMQPPVGFADRQYYVQVEWKF